MDEKSPSASFLTDNLLVKFVTQTYQSFSDRREALGLVNPGTTESCSKEVHRDVFLNNHAFTGMRADLTKVFSIAPMFQYTHAFAMGSQGLPPYNFSALFGNNKIFLQGNIDNEYQLSARANYRWSSAFVTKTQASIAPGGQSMLQFENEYVGRDFTTTLKALGPSYLQGGLTGIFIGNYMQSITPRFALGLEGVWQRAALNLGPEAAVSYFARYKGDDWIASANLQPQGAINATYWRRISDKVQAGVDTNIQLVSVGGPEAALFGGGLQKDAVTTVGAKYDFRSSTLRMQVDTSTWKLSCLLDKRVAPSVSLQFSGEMDHSKNSARIGVAVSIEAAPEELMEQQEAGTVEMAQSIPF